MKKTFTAGTRIDKNAAVFSAQGREISQRELEIALKNGEWNADGAFYCGDVVLTLPVKLSGLKLRGSLTVETAAAGSTIADCRIEGYIDNRADDLSLLRSAVVFEGEGLCDGSRQGLFVRDCVFDGDGVAISSYSDNAQITFCTVKGAIALGNAENQLAALNTAENISVLGAKNSVVLKNVANDIRADGCHALYVIENKIAGKLALTDNNYVNADLNECASVVSSGNENANGDNITDVNARPECGADKSLLPHVDRDLFVGMPRKAKVKDPDAELELTLPQFVMENSRTESIVIIAPGAYCSDECMRLGTESSDTTIYAYGVYAERQQDLHSHIEIGDADNIVFKGLTVAFKQQSCGQVYVVGLEGLDDSGEAGWLRVMAGAGLMNEFANSNPRYFNTKGGGACRDFYAYADVDYGCITPAEEDGTRRIRMYVKNYEKLRVGDVLTCRASNGGCTIYIKRSGGIVFYDFTMYGNAAGFAWTESNNRTATTYYRVLDTSRSSDVIDEETYNRYKEYEKKYGISFEVYIDEAGRFRGSPCHIGSIDATHTMRCGRGSVAMFCLFENMCDDGTNQNHTHARLASITDNGDGTSTVLYKGMQPMFFWRLRGGKDCQKHICDGYCADFSKGQRVFVYNSAGQLVCDTPALCDGVDEGIGIAQEYGTEYKLKSVKVATSAVNFKALDGYDLSKNTPEDGPGEKVMVDNMSLASNGFLFDNTVIRNIRSRGLLIKASDGAIRNCTFENVGMGCVAVNYEIFWGESGVSENLTIKNNLFDHTGFFSTGTAYYAPVSINGLGACADEDYLLYKNILIEGNRVRNRTTDYAVYVHTAKGVVIKNNDFGTDGGSFDKDVYINGAVDVEISDNKYTQAARSAKDVIRAEHFKSLHGNDVTENGVPVFADEE